MLVAWWGNGHAEAWFVLTDLAADGCDVQWMLMIGSDLELGVSDAIAELPDLSTNAGIRTTRRPRTIRLFRLDWLWLLVPLIQGQVLLMPRSLAPEPWPDIPKLLGACSYRIERPYPIPLWTNLSLKACGCTPLSRLVRADERTAVLAGRLACRSARTAWGRGSTPRHPLSTRR